MPTSSRNPSEFDIVIIGSGPGGYRAATLAALRKQQVAIIEKHRWGGCCLNRGCVPKKSWHNTATLLFKNKHFAEIGITGQLKPDFSAAWQHQARVSATIRDSYTSYMKRLGIQFFEGTGTIKSQNTVDITTNNGHIAHNLSYGKLIIATGSTAFVPDQYKNSDDRIITTDSLFETAPPSGNSVAVIGGGVIATELVFILQQLGKNISWYSRSSLLRSSSISAQAKQLLAEKLEELSLEPQAMMPDKIEEDELGVTLHLGTKRERVDWVLLATGRKPHTENLGVENTKIKLADDGFVETNPYLQTEQPEIYAIGDVRTPVMTANQAIADAEIAIGNIIGGNHVSVNEHSTPQAIYSRLEIAKIGLNEEQAEDQDYEPATGFSAFESSPAALAQNDSEGYFRIISDMDSGEFLGGEIVGSNAGELIHLLSGTSDNSTKLKAFAELQTNHPSRAEELMNATETLANKWQLLDTIYPKSKN